MFSCRISDEKEMHDLGMRLAKSCRPGHCVFLKGQLGAGKTTLVRGLLAGLGFAGKVKSPTYTLVEPYAFDHFDCYHFDLYRLKSPLELEGLGIRDYLHSRAICLFEWPERALVLLPEPDISIEITLPADAQSRQVRVIGLAKVEKIPEDRPDI